MMETLDNTEWDVLLSGTGLHQSLLALALSRSGKKILHVDRNDYYGGPNTALSLQDAEAWVRSVREQSQGTDGSKNHTFSRFRNAEIISSNGVDVPKSKKLGFSRSYSLALSPELLYTRSALLPSLVSSKIYRQLEFHAVGSWWMYDQTTTLKKIPSSREDVFTDEAIDRRAKRSLMKFLQLAADTEEQTSVLAEWGDKAFRDFVESHFGLPPHLQSALNALTLSPQPSSKTLTSYALPRIARHLTSIGAFGPGFGSVVPKWGGMAEVAQVACRAGAVGGGIYVLGKGVEALSRSDNGAESSDALEVSLEGGASVRTKWIAGCYDDIPSNDPSPQDESESFLSRSISIMSSSLSHLFPSAAEGAPTPACAVVVFPSESITLTTTSLETELPPVYFMIHNSETGECPAGQCVIYSSTALPAPTGFDLLRVALESFLNTFEPIEGKPDILWTLQYSQLDRPSQDEVTANRETAMSGSERVFVFPDSNLDLAFDDRILDDVRIAWQKMTDSTKGFMQFEDRDSGAYDEDD